MARYNNMLVATDLGECCDQCIDHGAELARQCGARLHVVHVLDYFPEDVPAKWVAPENQDPYNYLTGKINEEIGSLLARAGVEDANVIIEQSSGAATAEIVRLARETNADLIIMGPHRHCGSAALLGSTTNGVLKDAPCDVLVITPR